MRTEPIPPGALPLRIEVDRGEVVTLTDTDGGAFSSNVYDVVDVSEETEPEPYETTSGPWEWDWAKEARDPDAYEIIGGDGEVLAEVEKKNDARAIASLPEIRDAVVEIAFGNVENPQERAREALSALGEVEE